MATKHVVLVKFLYNKGKIVSVKSYAYFTDLDFQKGEYAVVETGSGTTIVRVFCVDNIADDAAAWAEKWIIRKASRSEVK